jgi:hypothetical protein
VISALDSTIGLLTTFPLARATRPLPRELQSPETAFHTLLPHPIWLRIMTRAVTHTYILLSWGQFICIYSSRYPDTTTSTPRRRILIHLCLVLRYASSTWNPRISYFLEQTTQLQPGIALNVSWAYVSPIFNILANSTHRHAADTWQWRGHQG